LKTPGKSRTPEFSSQIPKSFGKREGHRALSGSLSRSACGNSPYLPIVKK
jgi:hypothetical protein